jgi:tetratricopeptide (TPR) repeat protein
MSFTTLHASSKKPALWSAMVLVGLLVLMPDTHAEPDTDGTSPPSGTGKPDPMALEAALMKRPQDSALLFRLGHMFHSRQEYPRARYYLQRAVVHASNDPAVHALLGAVYRLEGNMAAAAASYKKSLEAGCVDPTVHAEYLSVLLNTGDAADALSVLGSSDTGLSESHPVITALVHAANNDHSTAKRALEHAAERSVSLSGAAMLLGAYADSTDDIDRWFMAARAADPGHPTLSLSWSRALLDAGDADGAMQILSSYLVEHRRSAPGCIVLGRVCALQGDDVKADSLYREALRFDPNNAEAHRLIAAAHLAGRRFEDARETYLMAIDLDDGSADAWFGYGMTLEALGESESAMGALDTAIDIDGSLATAASARREIMNTNRTETPLLVVSARFVDYDNSGILSPENPGIILIEVTNTGLGPAIGIRPELRFRTDVEGVTIAEPGSIDKLLPSLSGRIRVPVRITGELSAATAVIDVRVSEHWGFDYPRPLSVTIRLR